MPDNDNTTAKTSAVGAEPQNKRKGNASVKETKPKIRKLEKIDPNELVDVQSCTYGRLTYISSRNGCKTVWDSFGAMNIMTVGDLIDMRNSQRRFFEEPWIIIVGERASVIMEYLQVAKFYKKISKLEDFDEIFNYDAKDIPAILKDLSLSNKEVVARRAYALVKEGQLDSRKMIEAIENATGFMIRE